VLGRCDGLLDLSVQSWPCCDTSSVTVPATSRIGLRGQIRSSRFGHHQFHQPNRVMSAGTKTSRTIVTSIVMATVHADIR
jgi:hypothetical protein